MDQDTGARPSLGGDVITAIAKSPAASELISSIVVSLIGALVALIGKKQPKAPTAPVTTPTPAPAQPSDGIPDDMIPEPAKQRKVARVRLKLLKAQLSKARFPDAYTEANPFGLIEQGELRQVEAGEAAIPWASKVWTDLTAYDEQGREFLPPAVVKFGLAFKTVHTLDGAAMVGKGANPDGSWKPYERVDAEQVGNGSTAFETTNGFVHQFKVFEEGTFHAAGSVDGVRSNEFDVRVS